VQVELEVGEGVQREVDVVVEEVLREAEVVLVLVDVVGAAAVDSREVVGDLSPLGEEAHLGEAALGEDVVSLGYISGDFASGVLAIRVQDHSPCRWFYQLE
jgi:hypothetical protein